MSVNFVYFRIWSISSKLIMQKEKQTFLAKCADPNQSALPDQCLHCFQTDNKYIRAHMTGSSKLKPVDYMTLAKGVVKK